MGRRRKVFIPDSITDLNEILLTMATAPKQKREKMVDEYSALQFYNICTAAGYSLNGTHPQDGKSYFNLESHAEKLILKEVYDTDQAWYLSAGRKGGFTRRMGRVNRFINRKEKQLQHTNIDGFYTVRFNNWGDRHLAEGTLGVVWASNYSDARLVANQMYGHYSLAYDPTRLSQEYVDVSFICPGSDMSVISNQANDVKKTYEHSINKKRKQIEEIEKEIKTIEDRRGAILQTLADVNSIVLEKLLAEMPEEPGTSN